MRIRTKFKLVVEGIERECEVEITFRIENADTIPAVEVDKTEVVFPGGLTGRYNADWLWDAVSWHQAQKLHRMMLKEWADIEHRGIELHQAVSEIQKGSAA